MSLLHFQKWTSQWLQWPLAFFLSAFCLSLLLRSNTETAAMPVEASTGAISDTVPAVITQVSRTPQGQFLVARSPEAGCIKGANAGPRLGRGDTVQVHNIHMDKRAPECLRADHYALVSRGITGRVLDKFLPHWGEYGAGFITAITLGERGMLPPSLKQQFQQQGLLHLVAVSGLHFGLVAAVVWWILRLLPLLLGPAWSAATVYRLRIGLLVSILAPYAYIAGMAGSVLRAFVLFASLAMLTATTMRRYDPLFLLSWFGVGMLLLAPDAFFSLGMQLSFWITLALVWAARASAAARHQVKTHADPARKARLRAILWAWVAIVPTVSANLILALYDVNSNWSGILNNVIAIPVFGLLVLPSAWIALLAAQLGMPGLSAYPADFCMWCVDWITTLGWDQMPFAIPVWQSSTGLAACAILLSVSMLRWQQMPPTVPLTSS